MFVQEIFDWLLDPAGGGAYLAITLASWQAEALNFWHEKLTNRNRNWIIVVLSALAVVLATFSGEGNIDGLFADAEASLVSLLNVGVVYLVSQIAHALNPRR